MSGAVNRPRSPNSSATDVLDVVIEIIRTEGYHAVQVRTVAKRAQIGLDTLYRLFSNRDELIISAISRWMADTTAEMPGPVSPPGSLEEGLVSVYREQFRPWIDSPRMLDAMVRARLRPGGDRLDAEGLAVLDPKLLRLFDGYDEDYRDDVLMIVTNVVISAVGAVAQGALGIEEIIPMIERTVRRLTSDNTTMARPASEGGRAC